MTPLANIFQPIIDVLDAVIVFFHDSVGLSWGLSIIALTVTVRALLLPLAFKQFHSMQALQRHAPEIKALQQKYKNDRQRQQQEMMKFYQENKVNPFGSCLPLVLQMPIFLALFYMLREDLRVDICSQEAKPCEQILPGSADWFFIPDLTDKATGGVLVTLIVLYVGSQLLSSLLMSPTVDKTQKRIFMALPFVFVPFILSFPAGLILYWITTNFWTVGQQYVIRRILGPITPVTADADAGKGAAAPAGAVALSDGAKRGSRPTKRAAAGAAANANGDGDGDGAAKTPQRVGAPPPPPRRKKKRSGRRR